MTENAINRAETAPMDFSLIIPTYNEKDNIGRLLKAVGETLGAHEDYEIIVVDDDSPDLTWKAVEAYALRDARIRIIRRLRERGLSKAVIEGFLQAQGEILGVMDADLSHDHRILPHMIAAVRDQGCDLVVGSRRVPGGGADRWPWYRKISSDVATLAAKMLLDIRLSDPMSGYFALKREVFEKVKHNINPQGYKILLEIYVRSNPRQVREIPFIFKDRKQGQSKVTVKVMLEYFRMIFQLRFR
jgi:dolichol-phosphate mannosyltransferase